MMWKGRYGVWLNRSRYIVEKALKNMKVGHQSRQFNFVFFAVKKQTKSTSTCIVAFLDTSVTACHHTPSHTGLGQPRWANDRMPTDFFTDRPERPSKVSRKCQKFIKNLGVVEMVVHFALSYVSTTTMKAGKNLRL